MMTNFIISFLFVICFIHALHIISLNRDNASFTFFPMVMTCVYHFIAWAIMTFTFIVIMSIASNRNKIMTPKYFVDASQSINKSDLT